ncbi:FAD-dependent oxidoreductase [Mesorhizobium sp. M0659]|uniref:NAD(P)/FAD-dependent oxidoreductase n=1 Tax=Mesorhizobium sp. M0659 TaxID=2956980 RepID=UPI00333C8957
MSVLREANDAGQPYELVIVGAGPAGLSAATTASALGMRTAIIDEQQDVGGQILRQPPASFRTAVKVMPPSLPGAAALLARFRESRQIDTFFGKSAWGVFQSADANMVEIPVSGPSGSGLLRAKALLLATGAYDLPVAFPGWTLPGVMAAGGVQTLLKSQFLRPGRRFVLAGSHPLLLLVADLLLAAGAEIAEIAVARPRPAFGEILKSLPAVAGHKKLFLSLAAQLYRLSRHKVPVSFGTTVLQAQGNDAVERVILGKVDAEWNPQPGSERSVAADCLVSGYGLLASSELAQQAGCAVRWAPERGGWIVSHDEDMRTSVANIFVAGEPAGVKGAEMAFLEGRRAALSVALQAGFIEADNARKQIDDVRTRIARARIFSDMVLRFFAPRLDKLARLATDVTLICRCEEISAGTVRRFLDENQHVSDINSVKLGCRTGMGFCQGRYCQHTTAQLTADIRNMDIAALGAFSAQAPVKPVSVRALMDAANGG